MLFCKDVKSSEIKKFSDYTKNLPLFMHSFTINLPTVCLCSRFKCRDIAIKWFHIVLHHRVKGKRERERKNGKNWKHFAAFSFIMTSWLWVCLSEYDGKNIICLWKFNWKTVGKLNSMPSSARWATIFHNFEFLHPQISDIPIKGSFSHHHHTLMCTYRIFNNILIGGFDVCMKLDYHTYKFNEMLMMIALYTVTGIRRKKMT